MNYKFMQCLKMYNLILLKKYFRKVVLPRATSRNYFTEIEKVTTKLQFILFYFFLLLK